MESLDFSTYKIMSPAIKIILLLPFQFGCFLFLLLAWLLLLELPVFSWIETANRHTCLVPNVRGKAFNHSPLSLMLVVDFHIGLYCVKIASFYSYFESFKSWKNLVLCHMLFPRLLSYCVIFILHCFNVAYHIIDLHILKHPCIFRLNPSWSWCLILLIFCWIPFTSTLVEVLHLCSSGSLTYNFLCGVLVWHRICQHL